MVDWTPDLIERLRALWDEGVPTSKIAEMIGQGATKNSIIGKANRLRLRMRHPSPGSRLRGSRLRGTHPRGVRRPIKRPKPRPSRAKAPPALPKPPPVVMEPPPPPPPPPQPPEPRLERGMFTLLDLGPHECRWPVNAPERGGEYLFCGAAPTFGGSPYCEYHNRIGYQKGSAPRRQEIGAWVPRQVELP